MKILMANDNEFIELSKIAKYLQQLSSNTIKTIKIEINDTIISHPRSHKNIATYLQTETNNHDCIMVFTNKKYNNNYFYNSKKHINTSIVIVSMYEWDNFTHLSITNGIVYMYCSIINNFISKDSHNTTTGCLNDFLNDKNAVDLGMKSASFCHPCQMKYKQQISDLKLTEILNDLSIASRNNQDILDYWKSKPNAQKTNTKSNHIKKYDVFLCHNSNDKPIIREIYARLIKMDLTPWFDEVDLPAGSSWQREIEQNIQNIKSVAIFVGENGFGPWQDIETRAFINEFAKRNCPVIPVILPGCQNIPELPLFLKSFMWVDLRKIDPDPFEKLKLGITK